MKFHKYILTFIFYICSISSSFSAEKTVFLDIDFVLNNSNFGKSIYSKLDELNKKNFDNLITMEKELEKKKEIYRCIKKYFNKRKFRKRN